jgi:trans-aconitate 2-methyltransferase
MADWSPAQYLKFASERSRPALDLLNALTLANPRVVCDLGCGPGNSTALLKARYPEAAIMGFDNSPAMIAEAKKAVPAVTFELADIETWQAPADADLIYSNATFQWLKRHDQIMLRLVQTLKEGAVLAIQMPNNLNEPSHALMRKVAAQSRWHGKLAGADNVRETILSPLDYFHLLKPQCRRVDIWQTTYQHPLPHHRAIVEFVASTGLRPYLNPLTAEEQAEFRAAYEEELRSAYPALNDGTVLLAFPRLFVVSMS